MNWLKEKKLYLLILFTGCLFFIPYLGKVHLFDWDEINFAEAAREMLVTGDYLTVRIDYEPFHEKPPLFIWMQAFSMAVFGVNEFAARLPNAITGIITLLFLFHIGKRYIDEKFGILWVLAYLGSFLPHFYFKTGIIDPVFNLFIFAGVYSLSEFYRFDDKKVKMKKAALAGIMIGLAVLTKGPVGYLITIICWLLIWFIYRKSFRLPLAHLLIFTIIAFIPIIIWYSLIAIYYDGNILTDFLQYQVRLLTTSDAGHGGPVYYHFLVILFGCFPSSIIMLQGLKKEEEEIFSRWNLHNWLLILFIVVLVIFSIVKTKIIHYSSLSYYPVTFLAAYTVYSVCYKEKKLQGYIEWVLIAFGVLWGSLLIAFPIVIMNVTTFINKITDEFTKEILLSDVKWGGFEFLPGVFYMISVLFFIFFIFKKKYLISFILLYSATSILIFLILPVLAPKIEPYTQGAPIEFFQNLKNEDCYIKPVGYKSYAHFFYSEIKPVQSFVNKAIPSAGYENWLLTGDIDKPAYFSCKINHLERYSSLPGIKLLYIRNGFAFLKREKIK